MHDADIWILHNCRFAKPWKSQVTKGPSPAKQWNPPQTKKKHKVPWRSKQTSDTPAVPQKQDAGHVSKMPEDDEERLIRNPYGVQAWVARNCAFAKKNDKTVSEEKFKRCKEEVKENSPGVNEYAVCTDSMGGQPASYHKKKGKDKK